MPRFTTLDGLRGIAAVAVLLFHLEEISPVPLPGGYLAVDLFFLLSGFVIASAYLTKLEGMGIGGFLARRFVRLYPMYLVGVIGGIVVAMVISHYQGGKFDFWLGFTAILMLPWPQPGYIYPVIPQAWSLLQEVLVNLALPLVRPLLGAVFFGAVLLISAALVVYFTFDLGRAIHGVIWEHFPGGLARAVFSFTLGVVLSRLPRPSRLISSPLAYFLPVTLIAILACNPSERAWLDLTCIFAVFPAMIWLGVRIEAPRAWLMTALGDASYPLYCIHLLPILMALKVVRHRPDLAIPLGIAVPLGLFFMALFLARYVDPAMRKSLAELFERRARYQKG